MGGQIYHTMIMTYSMNFHVIIIAYAHIDYIHLLCIVAYDPLMIVDRAEPIL